MAIPDQELAKPGCFSRFLSLLLCSHYSHNPPPIHPETEDTLSLSLNKQPPNPMLDDSTIPNSSSNTITTPGLVARLMGLDSLPNTPSRISKRVAPDSVSRSKSVNFLDYLLRFDPTHEEEPNHRRVRTSSFREVPSSAVSFNPQDDLVVFLWGDDDAKKSDNVRHSTRKSEEKEKKKKKKISKLKNEPRRECGDASSSRRESSRENYKYKEPKFRKRAVRNDKSLKKTENNNEYYGCSTQNNLSPVSVLDVDVVGGGDDDFMFTNQTHFSGDANARPLCVKWKRNCSGGILSLDEVVEETRLESSINVNDGNYGYNNEELEGVMKKSETEYWSELMGKLVSLTESDIRKSDWRVKKKSMFQSDTSAFYEISFMFERKILDLLLREFVHELVQF